MKKKPAMTVENPLAQAALLDGSKDLILAMARRSAHLRDLCSFTNSYGQDEKSRREHLDAIATENQRIETGYGQLRELEMEHGIGVQALVGSSADSLPLYCGMALLIGARIHTGLAYDARTVGEIVQIAGPASEPAQALIVRDAFRPPEGAYLPHCRLLDYQWGLDGAIAEASDAALAKYLGRMATPVEEALAVLGGYGEREKSRR